MPAIPAPRARKSAKGKETPEQQARAKTVSGRVAKLRAPQIREILTRAAQMHPDIMAMLEEPVPDQTPQTPRVLDFEAQAQKVWDWMEKDYKSGGLSKALQITEKIVAIIESIAKNCGTDADPQTRANGLFSLCQIGEAIAATFDCKLRKNIRVEFGYEKALQVGMCNIIKNMGDNEIQPIATRTDEEKLLPALENLAKDARGYCVFGGLRTVMALLKERAPGCTDAESQVEGGNQAGSDLGLDLGL
ncbi:hypothetical protein N7541_009749 [Penicillium brevicompactum]|uniref:Uncharacterized protein n=1 Tax=Penicillium brevicompactum TaxID=5074 RepID=A0A9W9UID9_PENBR|nr:hypothetical protein N7541_009749 [Penicillium brevicompactum]